MEYLHYWSTRSTLHTIGFRLTLAILFSEADARAFSSSVTETLSAIRHVVNESRNLPSIARDFRSTLQNHPIVRPICFERVSHARFPSRIGDLADVSRRLKSQNRDSRFSIVHLRVNVSISDAA